MHIVQMKHVFTFLLYFVCLFLSLFLPQSEYLSVLSNIYLSCPLFLTLSRHLSLSSDFSSSLFSLSLYLSLSGFFSLFFLFLLLILSPSRSSLFSLSSSFSPSLSITKICEADVDSRVSPFHCVS